MLSAVPKPGELPAGCAHPSPTFLALQRDAAMAGLLLGAGARAQHPHLLDVIPPAPGTLFAGKVGEAGLRGRPPS